MLIQLDRVLRAYAHVITDQGYQHSCQLCDAFGVLTTDGTHLYYLSPYQLHPVVLVEDAGLGHAVVVVDGEATSDPCLDFRLCLHKPSNAFALRTSIREPPASHPRHEPIPEGLGKKLPIRSGNRPMRRER